MHAPGIPAAALAHLRESPLPDPVSWMPQTVGWYAVLGLVLLAAGRVAWRSLRRHWRNRYRRSALVELDGIARDLQRQDRRAAALAAVPDLLKRTALSAYPRDEVASLGGDAWLSFLDRTLGATCFASGEGRALCEWAYAPGPRLARVPDESVREVLRLARRWISDHEA
jgi:hypothetical protein